MKSLFKTIISALFLLTVSVAGAQSLEYGLTLDTNYMLIGDQQQLTFKAKAEPGLRIVFPRLQDTVIRGVEIISGPVRDSVKERDGRLLWEEKYVITVFDTGVYVIPPMPITVESKEYNNVLRTEPIGFVVNTYQVDPQKGHYDIVMPYDAPWSFAEILPYLIWVVAGLAVLILAWWFWQRFRKDKPLFTARKEEIPPYVKAIRSLDEIKDKKLWQSGQEKEYYTRLTDTVRQYLDEEFDIPAMEQTSGETLRALERCSKVLRAEWERLAEMLNTADFVKFAKFTPLQDENARYLNTAYDFVHATHQRLEAERAELQRQEELRKETEQKAPDEVKPAAGEKVTDHK